jgi:hypothetical protein
MIAFLLPTLGQVFRRLLLATLIAVMVPALGGGVGLGSGGVDHAFADDDDDDDGGSGGRGGGDDDSDDDYRPFREFRRAAPRVQRRAAPRRVAPPSVRADREIIAAGLTPAEIDTLVAGDFVVVTRDGLGFIGGEIVKLRVPPGITMDAARQRIRSAAPAASTDFNHYYRPGQDASDCAGSHCAAPELVGWPVGAGSSSACNGQNLTIGLIDTAINSGHAALKAGRIELLRLTGDDLPESGRQHGTAVAALLVGSADSTTPGLVPGARLIAVDVFHKAGGNDDRAEAYDLVRALDLIAKRRAGVINMSLSGPHNALVEAIVARLSKEGTVLVAAAGNRGPRAEAAYPAGHESVIAVTAVDRRKRVYRRAERGAHIDLAAPGVDIWTAASVSGARAKTGTSFAAPFVSAAAALAKAENPGMRPDEIEKLLAESAEDLGEPGRDPVFGWGLLNASGLCGARAP